MRRFYVPPATVHKDTVVIEGGAAHHIRDVLRLRAQDPIVVFDGSGREYAGHISEMTHRSITVTVDRIEPPLQERSVLVTLIQAIPRYGRMEFIIEKATELGIDRILPMQTARTIPLLLGRSDRTQSRRERWQRIAIEAAQQSGRRTVPCIEPIALFSDALSVCQDVSLSLIAALQNHAKPLREVLSVADAAPSVAVFIGPEGDFTVEEVRAAEEAGCRLVSLGSTILRCETAAVAVLATINYALNQ